MYERQSKIPRNESECRPDYEAQAKKQQEDLSVIRDFKESLVRFIGVVRPYRDEQNGLPQLLGTVIIDIMERERELERTLLLVEMYK